MTFGFVVCLAIDKCFAVEKFWADALMNFYIDRGRCRQKEKIVCLEWLNLWVSVVGGWYYLPRRTKPLRCDVQCLLRTHIPEKFATEPINIHRVIVYDIQYFRLFHFKLNIHYRFLITAIPYSLSSY